MNKALDLINKFKEDEQMERVEIGKEIFAALYFKQSYQKDGIYEDKTFTRQWSNWADNLNPRVEEVDQNHYSFYC